MGELVAFPQAKTFPKKVTFNDLLAYGRALNAGDGPVLDAIEAKYGGTVPDEIMSRREESGVSCGFILEDGTMNELVDRVAAAIATARDPEAMARAAIAAMREPTEAMMRRIDDGDFIVNDFRATSADANELWNAMIDAALNETATA